MSFFNTLSKLQPNYPDIKLEININCSKSRY
jgi:hypothetical protein